VTLTPVTRPLALGTLFTVSVGAGVTDVAGNALGTAFVATFRTAAPDTAGPRVVSTAPAAGAVDVSVGTAIQVTFTEAVAPATITGASFQVATSAGPVAGALSMAGGNTMARFTPSAPLPFATVVTVTLTGAITDVTGNALTDAAGGALTQPLTFSFTTGSFAITRPAHGAGVPERAQLILEASGSASLGIATVTFTVNGEPLPPATAAPFTTAFMTPPAATTPVLTIVATARTANGTVIGQDQVVVNVVVGLRFEPTLVGVRPGTTAAVRLVVSSPLASALAVVLSAGDAAVVTVPAAPVLLGAGETEALVTIAGATAGNTTLLAESELGAAAAIVSVSEPLTGVELTVATPPVAVVVQAPPSLGAVVVAGAGQRSVSLSLLTTPAGSATGVTVSSSDPAVASVAGAVTVAAGSRTASVPITTGASGMAVLTFRAGTDVRELTVIVGTPPPDVLPPVVAAPAGVVVSAAPSIGQLIVPGAGQHNLTVQLLDAPMAEDTPVTVSTSDPAIASVTAAVVIPAGAVTATIPVLAGGAGTAELTLRAGAQVRVLTVVVGTPPPGTVPPIVARPVGTVVMQPPSLGQLVAAANGEHSLTLSLLDAPAAEDTPVTVTSSDAAIASVTTPVIIPAGAVAATIVITTGSTGTAELTLRAGTQVRELTVVVGVPPDAVPPIVAPPVGAVVLSPPSVGQLIVPGTGQQTLSLQLLAVPAAQNTPVTVTSSDPAVATVLGSVLVPVGSQSAIVTIATGAGGAAFLTFRAGAEVRELTVLVGTPSPGMVPPIVTQPVGVIVMAPPSAGRLIAPAGGQQTLSVPLLSTPAALSTPVTITSSDETVAAVIGAVVVAAGSTTATMTIATGSNGFAVLTLAAGGEVRELTVIVGTPPAGVIPPIVAPPVQIEVE
jgi:hypothetical protein